MSDITTNFRKMSPDEREKKRRIFKLQYAKWWLEHRHLKEKNKSIAFAIPMYNDETPDNSPDNSPRRRNYGCYF